MIAVAEAEAESMERMKATDPGRMAPPKTVSKNLRKNGTEDHYKLKSTLYRNTKC